MSKPKDELQLNLLLQKELAERKLVEKELLQSKELLECVFNEIQDGISILDKDFNFIKTNRTIENWYSHALPLLGQKCFKIYHGRSEPCEVCPAVRAFNTGTNHFEVITYIGPKEGIGILEMYAFPLKDEKNNVTGVVEYVRDITKYKEAESELEEQKKTLEQNNIALSTVLGQIEIEKKQIKDNVIANAENRLLPIIQKLKLKGESRKYIDLLQKNIQELTSSFGTKLTETGSKLTPREIEICDLIKNGLTSKEISTLLNISCGTIGRHRSNIRSKLGVVNQNTNLSSYLQTI